MVSADATATVTVIVHEAVVATVDPGTHADHFFFFIWEPFFSRLHHIQEGRLGTVSTSCTAYGLSENHDPELIRKVQ